MTVKNGASLNFKLHSFACSREKGLMGVDNSGHCVDLEVLVRTNAGSVLDGAPVGEAGLGVVEPLVGQVLHVVGIHL